MNSTRCIVGWVALTAHWLTREKVSSRLVPLPDLVRINIPCDNQYVLSQSTSIVTINIPCHNQYSLSQSTALIAINNSCPCQNPLSQSKSLAQSKSLVTIKIPCHDQNPFLDSIFLCRTGATILIDVLLFTCQSATRHVVDAPNISFLESSEEVQYWQ